LSAVTADAVRSFVLEELAQPLGQIGMRPDEVPDDFDMLTSGLIDSFGVLELINELERHFEIEIDFEQLDPEGLTVIGPFSRYIERESLNGNGNGVPSR
jgi:acyl carrier protein